MRHPMQYHENTQKYGCGFMTERDAIEAEVRSVCAEAIGALRLLSESSGPIQKSKARELLLEAEHALKAAAQLVDRIP